MKKQLQSRTFEKLSIMNLIWITVFLALGCKKDSTLQTSSAAAGPNKNQLSLTTALTSVPPVAFFDANLDGNGNLSAYNQISGDPLSAMVIDPSRISVVNDPFYGSKRKVMYMNVRPQDTGGLTDNPRAQVQTPMNYVSGQTVYVGLSVRFTQAIWTYFLTFSEFYGAPYNGTSPFRLAVQGNDIVASTTDNGIQTNLWQTSIQPNVWYDFVYCETLNSESSKGSVQVWLRKQGATAFTQIIKTTKIATITAANLTGPNYHKLACYYDKSNTYTDSTKKTHVSAVKMYLASHKVGSSFNLVAPALIQ